MPKPGSGAASKPRVGDLEKLARSFARHLRAANKSPRTVQTYAEAVDQLIAHVARRKVVQAERIQTVHVETFMEQLLATRSPATAHQCLDRAMPEQLII